MSRPAVLVVSASCGTGHASAGNALRQALLERDPSLRVEHVDLLELAPRWVRATYGTGYERVAARAPWLWDHVYRRTDGDADDSRWGPLAHRLVFREFRRLLRTGDWGLCLCTHFLPCQLAAGRPGLPPFALVVTDFALHRVWVQPGVHRYFVATDAVRADLRRRRVRGARVQVSGIPISPAFAAAPAQAEARAALGLDPGRPVALVMGGGLGLGVEEATDAAVAACPEGVQVVAVCGRNEEARARLEARGLPRERLRVEGYTSGMERWLSAADLVATKPGGLTSSETLALGRPLLLTRPIPGAEEGNTRALVAAGAALAGQDSASLRDAFRRVWTEEGLLERLAAAARRVGRPDAAQTVASTVRREYLTGAVV